MNAHPELTAALRELVARLDRGLGEAGYTGPPIRMLIAGGMAVHRYCGVRYTRDIDASFSHRLSPMLLGDLKVVYRQEDGAPALLYLDMNYNPTFSMLHEDYEEDAIPWEEVQGDGGRVRVFTLSPLDLAVSKLARYSEQDREDILVLAVSGGFSAAQFRGRAEAALAYFVGNPASAQTSIDLMARRIEEVQSSAGASTPPDEV